MENEKYKKITDLLELQEFLSVIERDKKGNPVKTSSYFEENPDKIKLYEKWGKEKLKDIDKLNRTRLAESEKDFDEIYIREFGKYNTTIKNVNIYINEFKGIVNEKILTYKKTHSYNDYNVDLLKLANEFISFLDSKVLSKNTNSSIDPKHGDIFCNNGFVLFDYILNEYVKKGWGRLSDIHFFYWSMFNDNNKFIHQRPEPFKEWFFKTYKEDLGKIKTYIDVANNDRKKHYSNALEWFKLQNL